MDNTIREVTISSGESLSPAVDLGEYRVVGFRPPTAWTAAALTFDVSIDGQTYTGLRNDDSTGTEFNFVTGEIAGAIVGGVGQTIMFTQANREMFQQVPYLKLRSGTQSSTVNQAADRTFTLILERKWK